MQIEAYDFYVPNIWYTNYRSLRRSLVLLEYKSALRIAIKYTINNKYYFLIINHSSARILHPTTKFYLSKTSLTHEYNFSDSFYTCCNNRHLAVYKKSKRNKKKYFAWQR